MGESGEAQASPPEERIDFTLERGRHRRFVGRDDVLARLDEWLLGPDDTGWVVVTGGPGMGKSAILSKWLDRRETTDAAVPHHFVRREARSPVRRVNLDDDQWASSNEAVVRGFWEAVGPDYQPPLPASTVAAAIAGAEGNVLHAVMLHDVLRDLPPEQRRAERIPGGLRHLIGEVWDRAASTESVRIGLGLLCAAQEALSLDALAEVAAWSYDDKERFVREARQLLLEEPASWAGAEAYRPRHDWVRELMAERLGGAALRVHHETLARTLARWPSPVEPTARRYALRHALIHRVEARAWTDAWRLAADMSFLEAKCRELGAHEAEIDVERVAQRCRASDDEAFRERFGDLARALARESHWLRAAPEATAAQMWNRLRQLGWSADELDQQLQLPVGSRFLRVRHVATRESAALVRDLVGHTDGVNACAVTPDGRRVVSASNDGTLKVWDLMGGHVEVTLEGHADQVNACAVMPDGRRVVSASNDGTLKVWDLVTEWGEATLEGHAGSVNACAVTPDGRRVVSASHDKTLKVWDLASGRTEATLEGHASEVDVCVVMPDGRRVVSVSYDDTLKVWDLQAGACIFTHRTNATCRAIATTATAIIAGDDAGAVWFLDWPSPDAGRGSAQDDRRPDSQPTPSSDPELPAQRPPMKHTILFLAANPLGTDRVALDHEARAIQVELERSGFRDRFELVTRWAVEPLDLLRELRKLKPTVVHFSGHGTAGVASHAPEPARHRDVDIEPSHDGGDPRPGLFFQGSDGGPQLVSTEALEAAFGAAGSSVKLIVLSACYSELNAQALLRHVGCVVGMSGAIADDAARSFAIGFYGGLGERESIAAAYAQGCAAIRLQGLADHDRPKLAVRTGIDAGKLVLAADTVEARSSQGGTDTAGHSPASRHRPRQATPSQVDIGILTIRDDEFRAVLQMFPTKAGTVPGAHREYTLRHAEAGDGERYTITVLRQVEQGLGEAQTVARDLIEDLAPRLVLVVGIAGGLPSDDVTLGDVVLSTRIHDFTVEARKAGHEVTYAATGGPIDKALANAVADLANREDVLGTWTAGLPARPPVVWTRKGQLEGPPEWQRELRAKLEHHHGKGTMSRAPVYAAGPIASSDRLVKDPAVLIPWLTTARNLLAIEMESGGVYRAVRERCPMLAIRGISDIVGLKRSDAWTKYACAAAAAFTRAFLRTRPIELAAAAGGVMESPHARSKTDPLDRTAPQVVTGGGVGTDPR